MSIKIIKVEHGVIKFKTDTGWIEISSTNNKPCITSQAGFTTPAEIKKAKKIFYSINNK